MNIIIGLCIITFVIAVLSLVVIKRKVTIENIIETSVGPSGPRGKRGNDGSTGSIGKPGINGKKGVAGSNGKDGVQGISGKRGVQGIQGNTGVEGPQGPQGPQGPIGPQGKTGPSGPTGCNNVKFLTELAEITNNSNNKLCKIQFIDNWKTEYVNLPNEISVIINIHMLQHDLTDQNTNLLNFKYIYTYEFQKIIGSIKDSKYENVGKWQTITSTKDKSNYESPIEYDESNQHCCLKYPKVPDDKKFSDLKMSVALIGDLKFVQRIFLIGKEYIIF